MTREELLDEFSFYIKSKIDSYYHNKLTTKLKKARNNDESGKAWIKYVSDTNNVKRYITENDAVIIIKKENVVGYKNRKKRENAKTNRKKRRIAKNTTNGENQIGNFDFIDKAVEKATYQFAHQHGVQKFSIKMDRKAL